MSSFGCKRMMCRAVPKQSSLPEAGACRDYCCIALGSGDSGSKDLKVLLVQFRKAVGIRLEIIDEMNLPEARFALQCRSLDDPGQIRRIDASIVHRTSHAEACALGCVVVLALELEHRRLQAGI